MDVSAAEVLLALVLLLCAVGAVYGARWVSRRSDEQMERTRAALRARHAEPDSRAVPSPQVAVPQPARGEPATRQLPRPEPAAVPPSPAEPAAAPSPRVGSGAVGVPSSRGAGDDDVPPTEVGPHDPDSSGRHRVPEELMRAVTYSLSPDRVARAKVPGPRPRRDQDRLTDRRRS